MSEVLTPMMVEKKLLQLSKEIDEAHEALMAAEREYHLAKVDAELSLARARINLKGTGTVQERNDTATVMSKDSLVNLATAEAVVKSLRANTNRLRTQVDIVRSLGTSVRTSLEVN